MSGTKSISRAGTAVLLAVGVSAAFGFAARAQESEQPSTAFGYETPKQYLVNRMVAPPRPKTDAAGGAAAGQGANGGSVGNGGQAADNDDDNVGGYGQDPFPKRYLLNKMFDFGGGDSAPPAPPAATAEAPAVKSP